jgi:UDP-glucose:tetrahydrobiopterin glucosyltransferase
LKIAIIAHLKYPIAEPFFGGLEMHTHLLVDKLVARGHDVTLFAAEGSRADRLEAIVPPTALMDTSPYLGRGIEQIEHEAYAAIIARLREGSFDIIHCNALHGLPLRHAASLAAPMVAVLHTPPFTPLEDEVTACGTAVSFVAVSKALAAQWPPEVKTTIIPNGIDLARFQFGFEADTDRFAFWFGRIVPEKGLHLAIDAARAADLPLRIAGPMIDAAYWEEEIAPRLDDRATYLGHLEQDEIAAMLGRASVLVCTPRWEEPFGLVVAESLACGTPVAGFARGALPEILNATCGALAPGDDVGALAKAITHCLSLDRAACRARATLFDADQMIARYECLYRRVIAGRVAIGRELVDDADPV